MLSRLAVLAVLAVAFPAAALAQAPASAPVRQAAPGGFTPNGEVMKPTATLGPGQSGPAAGGAGARAGTRAATTPPAAGDAANAAAAVPRFPGMPRFMSVAAAEAVLYDAPSERARRIFLAPTGMPVEIVSVLRNWVKIRDAQGDFAWVLRDDLTDKRMVIASAVVPLRREPQPLAATWFNLDQGVVVELLDERPSNGFVRVRYAEGQIGWLPTAQIWGVQ